MKCITVIALALGTVACALGYNPRFYVNEVMAVNLTSAEISDVTIDVIESPKMLECEEVAKNAVCADRFTRLVYPQLGVEVSWTHTDGSRKTASAAPTVPVTFVTAFPIRIVMEINADGSMKTFYEQDEPDRGSTYLD